MNFGSPLEPFCCLLLDARGRQTYQPAKIFSFQLQLSQTRPVNLFAPKQQSIAYSGVVPELLLTHDPSRSRFRVYFKIEVLCTL